MLKGETAIVTGSTSGFGLGIAQARAAAGAHVMLNGLGEKEAIEKIRTERSSARSATTRRAKIAKAYGCDHPVIYTRVDFVARVATITQSEKLCVV